MPIEYYHKISPFRKDVNNYLDAVRKETKRVVYLMDRDSHELIIEPGSSDLMRLVHVNGSKLSINDNQQYIKLFTSGLPLLKELSAPGLKVFIWILANLKPKQDLIILVPNKVAKELAYKITKPIHDGVKELINHQIIARAYTGNRNNPAYYINPAVIFNGNRRHLWDDKYHK